jgi:NADP-dependent 3-hydroxy acid dehydrogenase YdfG
MAKAVLASGDKVVATARNTKSLAHLQGAEPVDNPNLYLTALDVTDEAQVHIAVDAALNRFGQIDVLVNNAGYSPMVRSRRAAQLKWNVFTVQMPSVY